MEHFEERDYRTTREWNEPSGLLFLILFFYACWWLGNVIKGDNT